MLSVTLILAITLYIFFYPAQQIALAGLLLAALIIIQIHSRLKSLTLMLENFSGQKTSYLISPAKYKDNFPSFQRIIDKVNTYIDWQVYEKQKQSENIFCGNILTESDCVEIFLSSFPDTQQVQVLSRTPIKQGKNLLKNLEYLFYSSNSENIILIQNHLCSSLAKMGASQIYRIDLKNISKQLWFVWTKKSSVSLDKILLIKQFAKEAETQLSQQTRLKELKTKVIQSRSNNIQKNKFISGLSHDLRSPVNNLQAILTCLKDTVDYNSEEKELLQLAGSNLTLLKDMVEDLLNLAKYRSGNLSSKFIKLNLKKELECLVSAFSMDAKIKNLTLKLADIREDFEIQADELQFKRIIANLISNAIKYTANGGVTLTTKKLADDNFLISIFDTGAGLSKEQISTICRPFKRFNDREIEGVGLGLAVTKLLIELHHGNLEIESRPGEGSEFRVILPKEPKQISEKIKKVA